MLLPKLSETFNSPLYTIQWTVTAYTLALSAVIPLSGTMAEKFGEKKVFLICLVLFTLGSVLCSFATSARQLIVYRIIQGIGGGMISPISMALTFKISPPDKIGRIMALIGIPMLIAPAGAPILAGWLADFISWKWVFLINLPIGIIAVLFGLRALPNFEGNSSAEFDILGMILAPIAFYSLAYGVSEGGNSWTSINTIGGIVIGVITLALFIIVELKQEKPLLELRVFKSLNFRKAITTQWMLQLTMGGVFYIMPIYFIQARGFEAFEAGLITLPIPIACTIFMQIGGRLFDKKGIRIVTILGLGILTFGIFCFAGFSGSSGLTFVMISLILVGAGMGICMMSIGTYILQCSPRNLVDSVTSLTSASQQVMSSFAVAGVTSILALRVSHYNLVSNVSSATLIIAYRYTLWVLVILAVITVISSLRLKNIKVEEEDTIKPQIHII